MKTVKELQSEKRQLQRLLLEKSLQIENLEKTKLLPKLKKMYKGRYFKFENSYDSHIKWNVYVFCKEVINLTDASVVKFETAINYLDKHSYKFENEDDCGFYLLQTEITKEEFDNEFELFKSKIAL